MSFRDLKSKSLQIAGRQSYTGPLMQNGGEENGGATIILERDDEGSPPGGAFRVQGLGFRFQRDDGGAPGGALLYICVVF
jgi:hypothetical protein